MGAVAERCLQGQELRSHDHQPRRAARHRHLRQAGLLLPVRQSRVQRDLREGDVGAQSRGVQGGAWRSAKEAGRGQLQRVPVPAAERDCRRREAQGPVEERADLRQRSLDDGVAMTQHARTAKALSTQPFRMSALEMLRLYRTRELSPVEAMRSVIKRVEAFEPHIHATFLYAPERPLKEARASEARWARAEPIGPLDGVPVTVKDNIATKGEPKPVGTAAEDLSPQKEDAPPAQRLREARAIIFTKTTMPDYGMLSSGLSSFHPLARNPWKLDRNPGGSSSGAGAAAAALYGPLHLGTDIGGSVRLPAGWCGIFGLKPSGGRIPIDPPYTGRVAGPMTRDVDDAALMMATLSLPDVRDYASLKYERLDWIVEPAQLKGLRVGLLLEAGCGAPPTPEVKAAVERAAKDFEAAGAHVEPLKPFLTQE